MHKTIVLADIEYLLLDMHTTISLSCQTSCHTKHVKLKKLYLIFIELCVQSINNENIQLLLFNTQWVFLFVAINLHDTWVQALCMLHLSKFPLTK